MRLMFVYQHLQTALPYIGFLRKIYERRDSRHLAAYKGDGFWLFLTLFLGVRCPLTQHGVLFSYIDF